MHGALPALTQCARGQGRATIGLAIAHIELVNELVNHHVVALRRRLSRCGHVGPTQCDRPHLHGLAAQLFGVAVHYASLVGHFSARQHGTGVHHNALEVVVPMQAQVQHRQAGLCGNRHGHRIRHLQAMRTKKLFVCQKFGAHGAQTPGQRRRLGG